MLKTKKYEYLIEISCNGLFGCGDNCIGPPDESRTYTIKRAEICAYDEQAFKLFISFQLIQEILESKDTIKYIKEKARVTLDKFLNIFNKYDNTTYEVSHSILIQFLSNQGAPNRPFIHAIGNCHIDTAWYILLLL